MVRAAVERLATDFDVDHVGREIGSDDLGIQHSVNGCDCDFSDGLANDSDFFYGPSTDCAASTIHGHVWAAKDSDANRGPDIPVDDRTVCLSLVGRQSHRRVLHGAHLHRNNRRLHHLRSRTAPRCNLHRIVVPVPDGSLGQTGRNASHPPHHRQLVALDHTLPIQNQTVRRILAEVA